MVVGWQKQYYGSGASGDYNQYVIDLVTSTATKRPFAVPGVFISYGPYYTRDYTLIGEELFMIQYLNTQQPVFCKYSATGDQSCASDFVGVQTQYSRNMIYAKNSIAYGTREITGVFGYNTVTGKSHMNATELVFDMHYDGRNVYGYNAIYIIKYDPETLNTIDSIRIPDYPVNTFLSMITYQGEFAFFDRADGKLKRYDLSVIKSIPNYQRPDASVYVTIDPTGRYVFFFEGANVRRYDFDTNSNLSVASNGAANRFHFYGGFAYSTGKNFNLLVKFNVATMEHMYTKELTAHAGPDVNFVYNGRRNLEFVGDHAYMGVEGVGIVKINIADGTTVQKFSVERAGVQNVVQGPNTIYFAGSLDYSTVDNWIGYITLADTPSTNAPSTATPSSTVQPSLPPSSDSTTVGPSTTNPSTTAPSTISPTDNLSGGNNARASGAATVVVSTMTVIVAVIALL